MCATPIVIHSFSVGASRLRACDPHPGDCRLGVCDRAAPRGCLGAGCPRPPVVSQGSPSDASIVWQGHLRIRHLPQHPGIPASRHRVYLPAPGRLRLDARITASGHPGLPPRPEAVTGAPLPHARHSSPPPCCPHFPGSALLGSVLLGAVANSSRLRAPLGMFARGAYPLVYPAWYTPPGIPRLVYPAWCIPPGIPRLVHPASGLAPGVPRLP